MTEIIPDEIIVKKIYMFRGVKVMLDHDLAELYGVETRVLNQAIKRNLSRFPLDFMFQLDKDEFEILISQFVTSSWGGVRKLPYVFTEHGILMLSNVIFGFHCHKKVHFDYFFSICSLNSFFCFTNET